MHIHILGICGTFMGSLAQLAREAGHRVTGADKGVYPPMSTQLEAAGIELIEGFHSDQLQLNPDVFVVGNVVSRGNPLMEAILDAGLPYTSGPQWLAEHILNGRWVLGVSGTHGKTTTSTMLAWILESAGYSPGFLIGGVPANFPTSARLGGSDFFVIEADEYDTAFFDKRSKFVHYHPNTLVINNLEFDHADIFADLEAIQTQFHHLLRTVPSIGLVVYPESCEPVQQVLAKGCWTPTQSTAARSNGSNGSADWRLQNVTEDGSAFDVISPDPDQKPGRIQWSLTGQHNVQNGLAAVAAARHVGVLPEIACEALCRFEGVKRRMELLAEVGSVKIYDDFAHHPTAIKTTLNGLRAKVGEQQIIAVIEPRSNTMKQGVHQQSLAQAVDVADQCLWYQPAGMQWSLAELFAPVANNRVFDSTQSIVEAIEQSTINFDRPMHIIVMSNGGFEGIHCRLVQALEGKYRAIEGEPANHVG